MHRSGTGTGGTGSATTATTATTEERSDALASQTPGGRWRDRRTHGRTHGCRSIGAGVLVNYTYAHDREELLGHHDRQGRGVLHGHGLERPGDPEGDQGRLLRPGDQQLGLP